ncbi:MAG TPA: ATP-binding cassette domain-containing protein, partial [Propionibacteriaceae bacterium]|nr:ATP-binding cassette domain-containing protein [Propionibacteriaceae bacterium]
MIHTRRLTRHFVSKKETIEAVRGVDIDVAAGELVAFLGPNGAGKSTTLRMLTTLLPPTSGTAVVAGAQVTSEPALVRSRIGYVGQANGAGHSFRVRDELVNQGRFYGMNSSDAARRADELLASLDLVPLAKRRVSTLSGGQRRRLDLALGLMHRPKLLFLDEPSTGMDPQNRANLWDHILQLRAEQGTTLVLTTHYLEEADAQAERVLVIDHGLIIADDTAPNLKANLAGD